MSAHPAKMSREEAKRIGLETKKILERRHYTLPGAVRVALGTALDHAVAGTTEHPPDETLPAASPRRTETRIDVVNASTMVAAQRLLAAGAARVVALNFANAFEPGGGFLEGARAQEEALCRSSGLYACILGRRMYAHHRELGDLLGTHWCIHSPEVPFFREDDGTFLDTSYPLSILTCAAPEANRLAERAVDIEREFPLRIERVLAVAAHHDHSHIVLGAWGCGAFGNDPDQVAGWFRQSLEGPFAGVFEHVVFAILDHWMDHRNIAPFERALGATAARRG